MQSAIQSRWAHRISFALALSALILAATQGAAETIPGPPIPGATSSWIGAWCPATGCTGSLAEAWIEASAFGLAVIGAILWAGRSSASQD